jgi:hypothetical protein
LIGEGLVRRNRLSDRLACVGAPRSKGISADVGDRDLSVASVVDPARPGSVSLRPTGR